MAISQKRAKRKVSGGRYQDWRKKKSRDSGRLPTFSKVGERKTKDIKTRAAHIKKVLLSVDKANIFNPKTKKYEVVKIETIVESPSNRNFVRRNILTKGTVIKTAKGNARVTSRPGQEGTVNAVLVAE